MSARCVEASALSTQSDPNSLSFDDTEDLEAPTEPLGQGRAVDALRFAVAEPRPGYNLVVVGPSGYGKHAFVKSMLKAFAEGGAVPSDWCYVHSFRSPNQPRALELPAGRGRVLVKDLEELVDDLKAAIPAAFESESFRARMQEIEEEFRERPERLFREVEEEARGSDIAMERMPGGVAFAPLRGGKVIPAEQFETLSEAEKERLQTRVLELQAKIARGLKLLPEWAREARGRVRELRREATRLAVDQSIEGLKRKYDGLPRVQQYLDDVREDVVQNADDFRKEEGQTEWLAEVSGQGSFLRYRVNLLVDHSETTGAPVVYDDRPALDRLVGRIEHRAALGALISDFTLIKPGSLHAANGGYLMLDLRKLLSYPNSWDALKRALFSRELRIENLAQTLGLTSGATLEPEPIPLSVKVVLIGDRQLHALLAELDPDVSELFRVVAEFDDRVDRNAETSLAFSRHLAAIARARSLHPLERGAVARVLDYAARLAGDARKLSTCWREVETLIDEADYLVRERGGARSTRDDISRALEKRIGRRDLVQRRVQEAILAGTLLVDTAGAKVGQVNGLSLVDVGGIYLGWPTRITATAHVGDGKVVDIEREVELGGALHSKGVLILSSYFAARYTRQIPLSLGASLVFEQSYAGVEGDSASLAELAALVSCLADVPIRQGIAVTGSVNQLGEVQAIGGVNDKIEGYFELCRARGLDGEQGVLIPAANVPHLMLSDGVVQACENGLFRIWAVDSVDDALEVLTGSSAGEVDENGDFPEDSVNGRVLATLLGFAVIAEGFSRFVDVRTKAEEDA